MVDLARVRDIPWAEEGRPSIKKIHVRRLLPGSVSIGIPAMIQVNRVARIGRQPAWRSGKTACCTVANLVKFYRIGPDLMAPRIVVANLEAHRFFRRAGVLDRPGNEPAGAGMLELRMQHFDRLRL